MEETVVRMVFKLEEAQALDHALASSLASEMMIFFTYDGKDELLRQARKGATRLRQAIARATDLEYHKDAKDEYVDRMQAMTKPGAVKTWSPWTDEEKAYVLESDEHVRDIALTLRRTFRGVKSMRKKLKQQARDKAKRHARKRGPK